MAKKESVDHAPHESGDVGQVKIRRGRVESVDLYELKDTELDQIEHSPSSDQFTVAIGLLSMAGTGIACLATSTFTNETIKNSFLFSTIAGIFLGGYLAWNSWSGRTSVRKICRRVRERIEIKTMTSSEDERTPDVKPGP